MLANVSAIRKYGRPRLRAARGRLEHPRCGARVDRALDRLRWRNCAEFVSARQEIVAFWTRKWQREITYRLIKQLWAYDGNLIAVRFAYEWHDHSGSWFRSYGNENW